MADKKNSCLCQRKTRTGEGASLYPSLRVLPFNADLNSCYGHIRTPAIQANNITLNKSLLLLLHCATFSLLWLINLRLGMLLSYDLAALL